MGSFRLGSVLGFEIRIHYSWFVIFALVLWTFATRVFPRGWPGGSAGEYWTMSIATTLLFFASLLAHELSHSVVARAKGIPVDGITLFLLGGMAHTRMEASSPGDEFQIAGVGPLSSLVLAAAFVGLAWAVPQQGVGIAVGAVAFYLGMLNALLAVFNLLPGFPLDGGRVFRALVWKLTGDFTRATRWASVAGQGFGYGLAALGVYQALTGDVVGGVWLVLIGWFLATTAQASWQQHRLQARRGRGPAAGVDSAMFEIPTERLPEGFAERIDEPPAEPAEPRPAATVVLLRDGEEGPEALLLRRNRSSGFVPGAYVFPGGRVDDADADPWLVGHASGLDSAAEPRPAFWMAAVREAFEETGVLLARDAAGEWLPDAGDSPAMERERETLMSDGATLRQVLESTGGRLDLGGMVPCAHWITPAPEPRRYDTLFFLAALPPGRQARPDAREMTDAVWLRPADAVERFLAGQLSMVFPTVKTLQALAGFDSVDAALDAFRGRRVSPVEPRLVRTPRGIAMALDEDEPA